MSRNVNVQCVRTRCKTKFVTAFDSLLERSAQCPKCDESWAVHMTYEDGRLIHPTNICPTCCAPALLDVCRCYFYCRHCVNGHELHTCPQHKVENPGEGPHDGTSCTCEAS